MDIKVTSKGFSLYNMRYNFVAEHVGYTRGKHITEIPTLVDLESIMRRLRQPCVNPLRTLEMIAVNALKGYLDGVSVEDVREVEHVESFLVSTPNGSVLLLTRDIDGALGVHNVVARTPTDWYYINSRLKKFEHNRAYADAGSRMQEVHESVGFLAMDMVGHQVWMNERHNLGVKDMPVTAETLQAVGFTVWGHTHESATVSLDTTTK